MNVLYLYCDIMVDERYHQGVNSTWINNIY